MSANSNGEVFTQESRTLEMALDIVAMDPAGLLDILGSVIEEGPAYLVGSLASGYGNKGSDVDIHIFGPDGRGGSIIFFIGRTMVDVSYFGADAVHRAAADLPTDSVDFGFGRCAIGAAPPPERLKRLSRWRDAIPVRSGIDPDRLLAADLDATVAAVVVRGGLESVLRAVAVAEVVQAGGAPAGMAYRVAARTLLELHLRTLGEVFIGRKWVWAKARRRGVPGSTLRLCDQVRTFDGLTLLQERLNLPLPDALATVVISSEPGDRFSLGNKHFALMEGRRLVPSEPDRREYIGELTAHRAALAGLSSGALRLDVDANRLDDWLCSARN